MGRTHGCGVVASLHDLAEAPGLFGIGSFGAWIGSAKLWGREDVDRGRHEVLGFCFGLAGPAVYLYL